MEVPSCKDEIRGSPYGCIRSSAGTGAYSWEQRTLIDINGDGLPDLMIFTRPPRYPEVPRPAAPNDVQVYYGTGKGFDLGAPQSVGVPNQPFNTTMSLPGGTGYGGSTGQMSGYFNISGSGYPDYVSWGSLVGQQSWTDEETGELWYSADWGAAGKSWRWDLTPQPFLNVFLNNASELSFTTGHEWSLCTPPCPSLPLATTGVTAMWRPDSAESVYPYPSELRQAFMDFDGDGQVELVSVEATGTANPPFIIYKAFNGQPPRRLSRIETGTGWQTDITYGHPQQNDSREPLPLWPVDSITVTDNVTGDVRGRTHREHESQDGCCGRRILGVLRSTGK